MDLSDPTRSIAATLDGAVLVVLASAGRPLTVGQVASQTVRGSEIGVRRSLARLVRQGIVRATLMGRNQVHELNRDHVAAAVAIGLAGLRTELWHRFRDELATWSPRPLVATVFGSAARGDGDESSDIDLLLVHPPFPGEKSTRLERSLGDVIIDALGEFALPTTDHDAAQKWESQIDRLRDLSERWTGNPLQVVDLGFHEWLRPTAEVRQLRTDVERDGVELVKFPAPPVPTSARSTHG